METSPQNEPEELAFIRSIFSEYPFRREMSGLGESDIVGWFHQGEVQDFHETRKDIICRLLSSPRKLKGMLSFRDLGTEPRGNANEKDIGVSQGVVSVEAMRQAAPKYSIIRIDPTKEIVSKIISDESLLKPFLLPWKSRMTVPAAYEVAMKLCGDENAARRFMKSLFLEDGDSFFDSTMISKSDRDLPLYLVLQKYAWMYFRMRNALLILDKAKDIVGRFVPVTPPSSINFDIDQIDGSKTYPPGNENVNIGHMGRWWVDDFVITVGHVSMLAPDNTGLSYEGVAKDFRTILHEYLHVIFDKAVDPDFKIAEYKRQNMYDFNESAYIALTEGFATFGEMLALRTTMDHPTHFDLGASAQTEMFGPIIESRLEFLKNNALLLPQYQGGVKILTYIFMRDGEKALDTIKRIDPEKAARMSQKDPLFVDAVMNDNVEPLLTALSR